MKEDLINFLKSMFIFFNQFNISFESVCYPSIFIYIDDPEIIAEIETAC